MPDTLIIWLVFSEEQHRTEIAVNEDRQDATIFGLFVYS